MEQVGSRLFRLAATAPSSDTDGAARTAHLAGRLRGPAFKPVSFRGTIFLLFRPDRALAREAGNLSGGEGEQGPRGIPAEFVRACIVELLVRRFF
jgi:hypothetical protein